MTVATPSANGCRWQPRDGADCPQDLTALFSDQGASGLVEALLERRGIATGERATFLKPTVRATMAEPNLIAGMEATVERLAAVFVERQPLTLLADFDVDGASSAALFLRYADFFGMDRGHVRVEVPDRLTEGFGPNPRLLDAAVASDRDLVVCLDCGTSAASLLGRYRNQLEVIVIDHHRPEGETVGLEMLVNPCTTAVGQDRFGALAAVGVLLMVLVAVNRRLKADGHAVPDLMEWLDLVALGTICDVMPMTGLNRAVVHRGLELLGAGRTCLGLKALCRKARLGSRVGAEDVSFGLGPRLNAASRQGQSSLAWQVLAETDSGRAAAMVETLDRLNEARKSASLALGAAVRQSLFLGDGFCFASGDRWPLGILGIQASHLVRRYHVPCFVVGYDDDGRGSGSARSVAGVDLAPMLHEAVESGVLERGGGHAMAGGFGLRRSDEGGFLEFVEDWLRHRPAPVPTLAFDGSMTLAGCQGGFVAALGRLEPYGSGNPEPLLLLEGVRSHEFRRFGADKQHLKTRLVDRRGNDREAVAFHAAEGSLSGLLSDEGVALDVLVRPARDFFSRSKLVLMLKDARWSEEG